MYALVKFGQMRRAAGPAFDPDAAAWAAAVISNGGTVTLARSTLVGNLIRGLQTDGIWTKLDRLWILAAENEPSARTDIKALALATAVSSPTFFTDIGYQSDGSSSYIDSEYDPTNDDVNYAQNAAMFGLWSATVKANGIFAGVGGVGKTQIVPSDGGGSIVYNLNTDNSGAIASATSDAGSLIATRTGNDEFLYQGGVQIDTDTIATDGIQSNDFFICCRDTSGSPGSFSNAQIAAFFAGGFLTSTEAANLHARLSTYMAAVITAGLTDTDVIAWVGKVLDNNGWVSTTRASAVNTLITGLKSDGVWTKLDRLWLFAAENPGAALTDLKAQALATNISAAAFTADLGYKGDGSADYIDSNFNPTTAPSPGFVQDSACMFAWNLTYGKEGGGFCGYTNASGSQSVRIFPAYTDGNMYWDINTNAAINVAWDGRTGLYLVSRSSSSASIVDVNGANVASDTTASIAPTNDTLVALAAGGGTGFSSRQCACFGFGANLSSGERTAIYSRLQTYMIAVGAATDDLDVNNWVSQVKTNGGTVSNGRRTHVYNLITGLKSDGVWSKLDRLWLFAAENAGSALVDLKAGALATTSGSPSFTTDSGYAGNGSSSYIDTVYVPSTGGGNFTQNSASFGFWVPSGTQTSGRCLMGAHATSDALMNLFGGSPGASQMQADLNATGASPALSPSSVSLPGLWAISRTASNVLALYQNGSASGSGSSETSTANVDASLYVLARNRGFADQFSDASVSAAFLGGGLTATEQGNLYSRLRTYMTAVGVP